MKITMLSPFSARAAGMNRLYPLGTNTGMDVDFILPKQDKYGISQEDKLFYFPTERKSFLTVPIYILKAFLHLKSTKPDVVYFYKPHPFTFPPVFLYKLTHRDCITIFDCDEWEPATLRDNDEPYYKQLFMQFLSRFCFWFSDKIVYTNEYIKEDKIPERYWSKCLYLPNAVDTKKFKLLKIRKHKGFNVFLVSYLHKIKHILLIVDTVDKAKSNIPNLKCHIIGEGPRRWELESMIDDKDLQEYFVFHGKVPSLQDVLSLADVIIVPYSDMEGMHYQCNIKIFEFMAMGLPIIATDIGEIGKYLEHGDAGYVVKPDADELAMTLEFVYMCREKALQKAVFAREISVGKNNWKVRAEKLEAMINER